MKKEKTTGYIKPLCLWAAVLLWMGLIFGFSGQTGERSSALSGGVLHGLFSALVPGFRDMSGAAQAELMGPWQLWIRKTAHFLVYLVLGALTALAAGSHPLRRRWKFLLPAALCLLYAAGDEFHQSFIPGRAPQVRDVCIDFAGALTGILLTRLFCSLWERHRRKRASGGEDVGR